MLHVNEYSHSRVQSRGIGHLTIEDAEFTLQLFLFSVLKPSKSVDWLFKTDGGVNC